MKILFIGLDGADQALIRQWAKAGLLPHLHTLMKQGMWGITQDPVGINGCHWPTFASGISPTQHGRYWVQAIQPGTYEIGVSQFQWHPFWQVLSDAGRKVVLIDAPEAPPNPDFTGIQITERNAASFSDNGENAPQQSWRGSRRSCGRKQEDIQSFRQNLLDSIERKTQLIRDWIQQDSWDLLFTSFRESHWVGHQCWHLHDPHHPEYDPEIVEAMGNPIQDIYRAIDSAIGQLLSQIDSDTMVWVFASTGMGPNYTGVHLLDDVLMRLENPETAKRSQGIRQSLNFFKQYSFLRKLKKKMRRSNPQKGEDRKMAIATKNARRSYFQVPSSEAYGGIRLNLMGREPNGTIEASAYQEVCQQLRLELLALVNPETQEPLIEEVYWGTQVYQGAQPNEAPDLLVHWNRKYPINSAYSPKIGKIEKIYWDNRTGDHRSGGLFIANHPSITPEKIDTAYSILDLSPTLSALLNVALDNCDGKPIPEIIPQFMANTSAHS